MEYHLKNIQHEGISLLISYEITPVWRFEANFSPLWKDNSFPIIQCPIHIFPSKLKPGQFVRRGPWAGSRAQMLFSLKLLLTIMKEIEMFQTWLMRFLISYSINDAVPQSLSSAILDQLSSAFLCEVLFLWSAEEYYLLSSDLHPFS